MKISNLSVIQGWSQITDQEIDTFGDNGDFFRQHLLNPALLELLGDVNGKTVLDAGCGTGYLSRMLAMKGAKMTGLEPAESMSRFAVSKEKATPLGITYLQEDLSEFHSEGKFDSVVSNMVFMDIPTYETAIKNCINALKSHGSFIFSISHPCFEDVGDEWEKSKQVTVREYLKEYEVERHHAYSFHRPLSTYINLVVESGCEIVKMIEPKLDEAAAQENPRGLREIHIPSFVIIHAVKK
jgi:2-polyprenyl-3-methyl-5-hydroxy-6-metoxy-1,4-benzoquinol methylase